MANSIQSVSLTRREGYLVLFLASSTALFLELMLIRWISTEIRVFAYLQSSILITCILGLGMGCFSGSRQWNLVRVLPPIFLLSMILSIPPLRDVFVSSLGALAVFGEYEIWDFRIPEEQSGTVQVFIVFLALVMPTLVLALIWFSFIPLGQVIGRCLDQQHNTIAAYSVNIVGSFLGIGLFTVLSVMQTSPFTWVLVFLGQFLTVVYFTFTSVSRLNVILSLAAAAMAGLGGLAQHGEQVVWSPYQKLELRIDTRQDPVTGLELRRYIIFVNNTVYQAAFDLRPEFVRARPGLFKPEWAGLSQYDLPNLLKPNADKVLIVGSGAGNDVAGFLRNGSGHVTAVEIDPVILSMGQEWHPEQPYEDPRVTVIVDDARSFFASSNDMFDLIVFGLLDSHTTGAMTNARLDHYVYTLESLEQAKSLLAPDGIMVLSFAARKPYISDRIAISLKEVFGIEPLVFRIPGSAFGYGGVIFVTGDPAIIKSSLSANPRLGSHIAELQTLYPVTLLGQTEPITDDWPYLYLEQRTVPLLFVFLALVMTFIFLLFGRWAGVLETLTGWARSEWHFFFLGAAFMLLEVSMISRAAVSFGSTWLVNSVIIAGVFVMILCANLICALWKHLPIKFVCILLIVSCGVIYFVTPGDLSQLQFVSRILAVGALSTMPLLFSGLLFIYSFRQAESRSRALGANLLGALVGGMCQSLSFAAGLDFLMLLIAAIYLAAIATAPLPRHA